MSFTCKRLFSVSTILRSHIGSAPVYLTPETKFIVESLDVPKIIRKGNRSLKLAKTVTVEGPLGKVSMEVPDFVDLQHDEKTSTIGVSVKDSTNKIQKSMWGTVRSHLNNHVTGVNEGHMAVLKFVGTGYRAQLDNNGTFVNVKVGASVVQGLTIPEGIAVKSPVPTSLIVEGVNKQQVLLFAAKLRKFHPPEPYKGCLLYTSRCV